MLAEGVGPLGHELGRGPLQVGAVLPREREDGRGGASLHRADVRPCYLMIEKLKDDGTIQRKRRQGSQFGMASVEKKLDKSRDIHGDECKRKPDNVFGGK